MSDEDLIKMLSQRNEMERFEAAQRAPHHAVPGRMLSGFAADRIDTLKRQLEDDKKYYAKMLAAVTTGNRELLPVAPGDSDLETKILVLENYCNEADQKIVEMKRQLEESKAREARLREALEYLDGADVDARHGWIKRTVRQALAELDKE